MLKVVLLAGPTGVGKTLVASLLCKILNAEIISCDSVQVYKDLVIGANKEYLTEILPNGKSIPIKQHMIDLVECTNNDFSVGDYYDQCYECIRKIHALGKIPLLVGGTGYYMNWILRGKSTAPVVPDPYIDAVRLEYRDKSWEELYEDLYKTDPIYAATVDVNDRYRAERALATCKYVGRPLSSFSYPIHSSKEINPKYDFRCFFLTKDRIELLRLIDQRCEEMLSNGLLEETIKLKSHHGLDENCTAGKSIGYYQTLRLLKESASLIQEKADEKLLDGLVLEYIKIFQTASRNYSRRQDSWFHKDPNFLWLHWKYFDYEAEKLVAYLAEQITLPQSQFLQENTSLKEMNRNSRLLRFDGDKANRTMRTYQAKQTIYSSVESRRHLVDILKSAATAETGAVFVG